MNQELEQLISIYAHKGLLIDTNILLLYYVGYVNRERIVRFKASYLQSQNVDAVNFNHLRRLSWN